MNWKEPQVEKGQREGLGETPQQPPRQVDLVLSTTCFGVGEAGADTMFVLRDRRLSEKIVGTCVSHRLPKVRDRFATA